MVHYRPRSPTSAYKTYLYLQAKMSHKANQTRAAKPTASPLLAVQGMYTNRRTQTNMSISSNTLFTLLSLTTSQIVRIFPSLSSPSHHSSSRIHPLVGVVRCGPRSSEKAMRGTSGSAGGGLVSVAVRGVAAAVAA
ncbi:hypothetical protein BHE74_00020872 [Ensete ventricosum]|nr:hypothetical protein BHE74_00020872 [Ensete ventricosum]RZR93233.1 hypothetical protein BHM03_00021680 [Ensete ventricosum]